MIKLIYEPSEELREFTVDRAEITKEEYGSITEYVNAFGLFLKVCGFMDGTIKEALPTFEN